MNELFTDFHFPVGIHRVEDKSFLPLLTPTFNKYVADSRKKFPLQEVHPVTMTDEFFSETELVPFFNFIIQYAEQALHIQGYNVARYDVILNSVFGQQHEFSSGMESHLHSSVLSGFYFLEVPQGVKALFYDPKDVKVFSGLEENPQNNFASAATNIINYDPVPGLLMLTPSWLKHSFTRNPSKTPFKFVHISVTVQYNPNKTSNKPGPIII